MLLELFRSLTKLDISHTLLLALTALLALLWLWVYNRTQSSGIPLSARILAMDHHEGGAPARTYKSARYGLSGRPDYVLEIRYRLFSRRQIPVEVKAMRRGKVRHWDTLQLGVYLLLIEEASGKRPPYGILNYIDSSHRIVYTDKLREAVLQAAAKIRIARTAGDAERQHRNMHRCQSCGYRDRCSQAL